MTCLRAAVLGALWAALAAGGGHAATDVAARAPEIVAREWSGLTPPAWVAGRPTVRVLPGDDVAAEVRRLGDANTEPFRIELTVSVGLLKALVGDDADALAGVLGHELAHVVLGHHRTAAKGRQEDVIIGWGASREAELAADKLATEIAGRGGYDPQGLGRALQRARERLGNNSYWDSLGGEHPTYTERLAALEQDRAALWQAALDFEIGVDLLGGEDFPGAELCFRGALEHFPQAPEVLCNLGFTLLMVYYRALPVEHWGRFDLGQPLAPGYATFLPVEPRRTRGEAEMARLRALWTEAVGYLHAALRQDPRYALAQGNLGFAYLAAPDGPQTAEARKWLAEAAQAPGADMAAAVANDRALVAMLSGDREGSLGFLQPLTTGAETDLTAPAVNLCLLLGSSISPTDQQQAADRLQELLPRLPAPSAQWEYAHGKYLALCRKLQRAPLAETKLLPPRPRRVTAHLASGEARLYLGTSLLGVVKALGGPEAVVPLGQGELSCWRYPRLGLELVLAQDRLVRAKLAPGAAATIEVLREGTPAGMLAAGDAVTKLEGLLPPYDGTVRLGDGKPYRYYAGARVAALVEKGQITALALVGARP